MDNKKKTRVLVRILCAILAVIMTLSIILPVAYAAEAPLSGEGFEYVEQDGEWYLNATGENPVVRLTNVPDTFVRDNMPVLIANLDTFEVHILNLLSVYGYAEALDIEEGYYVVVTTNYCWADVEDNKWVINNADTMYFYYGDEENFISDKYDLNFVAEDNIIDLPFTLYTGDSLPVVRARGVFHFDEEDSIYPLDEIYNWDELITRMEHVDLEQSLETGHPVYTDGYVPNSPEYYTPTTNTGNGGTNNGTPNSGVLDDLASAGATPPTGMTSSTDITVPQEGNTNPPESEVPVATPEIQETKPLPEVEIENQDVTKPVEEPKTPIEIVGDQLGIDTTPITWQESLVDLFDGLWIYILLLVVFGGAYFYLQNKKATVEDERTENDMYDDSRIE